MSDPSGQASGVSGHGREQAGGPAAPRRPRWVLVSVLLMGLMVVAFVAVHLAAGGLGQH